MEVWESICKFIIGRIICLLKNGDGRLYRMKSLHPYQQNLQCILLCLRSSDAIARWTAAQELQSWAKRVKINFVVLREMHMSPYNEHQNFPFLHLTLYNVVRPRACLQHCSGWYIVGGQYLQYCRAFKII